MTGPVIATKKPTTVEAWRWDGTDEVATLICEWINSNPKTLCLAEKHPHEQFIVLGYEYDTVKPGEWVIRDQFNDYFPLPDHVFRAVYDSPAR